MPLPVVIVPSVPTPPPPPPPEVQLWHGLRMTWTGWDGSVWDLTDPDGGVALTAGDVLGMHFAPGQRYTSKSPTVHGSTWRGWVADERPVFWPLLVYSDAGSAEWTALDAAFWRTMRPDKTGAWAVIQPSGESRSLVCRGDDDGNAAMDHDPVLSGWAAYGARLVAEQPFWAGEPESRIWRAAVSTPVFPEHGAGYVFEISPAGGFGNAAITNRGDVDAFPVWTITGPVPSATLGVGDGTIEVPFPVAAGDALTLDSHPQRLTATTGAGVDVTDQLGIAEWRAIPAGAEVPLTIAMNGAGEGASVRADLVPLFHRAVG